MSLSDSIYTRHPWKFVYLLYQLTVTFTIRLPIWIFLSMIRRPRQSWSVSRTVLVQLLRQLVYITAKTGPISPWEEPGHRKLVPNSGGVWVEPLPSSEISDELLMLASASGAVPVRIPGYWIPASSSLSLAKRGEKVLYSLHGGGYYEGTAHPSSLTATIPASILKSCPSVTRAFAIEYRLSTIHENAFPAALLDALSGYHYLVNILHISPSDIIVEGDSAGGNLALALTRYLVSNTTNLPVSSSLLLLSPWCDIGLSHDVPPSSSTLKLHADYDPEPHGVDDAKRAFLGPNGWGAAEINPYISPASRNPGLSIHFRGFPPTFIVAGGAENLAPQIRLLRDRMQKDLGSKLRYFEADGGSHDYVLFSWQEPERSNALREIADWIST
ncbi:Alpha/Beta hydrolase protein [Armillaria nabsnona]|nr:Alpha/Beta hydrolase protein [Armillaria nabsnona]